MPTWKQTLNARQTKEVYAFLLTFEHDDLDEPIRITDQPVQEIPDTDGIDGIISNGEEFIHIPFSITLPNQEKDTIPSSRVSVDNISDEITAVLATLSSPPTVKIAVTLCSNPDLIQYQVEGLRFTDASYNELTVDGEFSAEYFLDEPYGSVRFTPSRFPGIFRGRSINTSV